MCRSIKPAGLRAPRSATSAGSAVKRPGSFPSARIRSFLYKFQDQIGFCMMVFPLTKCKHPRGPALRDRDGGGTRRIRRAARAAFSRPRLSRPLYQAPFAVQASFHGAFGGESHDLRHGRSGAVLACASG